MRFPRGDENAGPIKLRITATTQDSTRITYFTIGTCITSVTNRSALYPTRRWSLRDRAPVSVLRPEITHKPFDGEVADEHPDC